MTSPQGNPARREPLLWLQLLGLAALPLEAAALLVVLAGADPGPLPGLERVFAWSLGALGPAVLFWRLPPDLWSLLLLQTPVRGRRPDQLRLSALQGALPLKLLGVSGAALLLPLLWWSDKSAGLAWSVSPFTATPRLVVLLLAALVQALMLWQWQQIVQALWLFSRPAARVAEILPLSTSDAAERRLNLGLPLLLLPALQPPPTDVRAPAERAAPADHQPGPKPQTDPKPDPAPDPIPPVPVLDSVQTVQNSEEPLTSSTSEQAPTNAAATPEPGTAPPADRQPEALTPEALAPDVLSEANPDVNRSGELAAAPQGEAAPDPSPAHGDAVASDVSGTVVPVPVEPEQAAEDPEGGDLDQQV